MILSLANVKGGVGKTTTAVNLAAAYAQSGLEVLLVDLDPQGSASFSLDVEHEAGMPSSWNALVEGAALAGVIQPTAIDNLEIVPGTMELAEADLALARRKDPERKLAAALAPVRRRYDAILIDCPPGLSLLTLNGLAASHAFILPVVPHDLAHEALGRFFQGWERVKSSARSRAELLGILLTMVDHRANLTDAVVAEIRRAYGRDVFRTEIPINVRLAEAPGYGMTIFQYESWSTGAEAYAKLGAESIGRARKLGLI